MWNKFKIVHPKKTITHHAESSLFNKHFFPQLLLKMTLQQEEVFGHIPHLQCSSSSTVTQSDTTKNCWYTVTQEKNLETSSYHSFLLSINSCALVFCLLGFEILLGLCSNEKQQFLPWSRYTPTVYTCEQAKEVPSCLQPSAFHCSLTSCATRSTWAIMPWSISEQWFPEGKSSSSRQTVLLQTCAPCNRHLHTGTSVSRTSAFSSSNKLWSLNTGH